MTCSPNGKTAFKSSLDRYPLPPTRMRPTQFTFANIVQPGTLYGERINQIDLRFGKILRYARTKTNVSVDLFNVFNASPVMRMFQTYGPSWLQPTSIMSARLVKLSVQVDF